VRFLASEVPLHMEGRRRRGEGGRREDPHPHATRSCDEASLLKNRLGGSAYSVQGYLAHKKTLTLLAPPGTLGIGLR